VVYLICNFYLVNYSVGDSSVQRQCSETREDLQERSILRRNKKCQANFCKTKALLIWDILAHNIVIKRYCNIFEPWISMTNKGKLLTNHKSRYFMFLKELTLVSHWNPWLKNIFYCNIFLSFYHNIKYQNVTCE